MTEFSPASVRSLKKQPGSLQSSSLPLDWRSLLVQEWLFPTRAGEFNAPETDDQTIVVFLEGSGILEAWKNGRWSSAYRACGSVGLTAPGERDRLRWSDCSAPFVRTAHVYLPKQYLAEASETLHRAGAPRAPLRQSALSLNEPTLRGIAQGLVSGVRSKVPPLYAETAAVYLATHMAATSKALDDDVLSLPTLSDRRLGRAVEYMRAKLAERISLRALAEEACLSRFHFARAFKERTGDTPIQYLLRLRMERARELLAADALPIAEIARRCGYTNPSSFCSAVRRHHGASPAALRRRR